MAETRRAGLKQVNVFHIGDAYLFKYYFDVEDAYQRVKQYYNIQQSRFEVAASDFEELRSALIDHGYNLDVVDETAPFVVVVRKYTAHPEEIRDRSVAKRSVDEYNCFLMPHETAIEDMVDDGAARLVDTTLDNPF